jgi:hypothetical protein
MPNVYCVRFGRGTYVPPSEPTEARAIRLPTSAVAPSAAPRSSARRLNPRGDPPSPLRPGSRIGILLLAGAAIATLCPSPAWSRHLARLDPTEPIFTQRAFVEKNLEFETSWDKASAGNGVELAPGATWVFWKRLELDASVPFDIQIPRTGPTVGGLGDVAFGAQLQLCCEPEGLLDYFSVRADVATPTGDVSKGTGGIGSWTVSLLPARRFTIVQRLPDLMVQMQLAYVQDIRGSLTGAGDSSVRQKAFLWNTALAQQYWEGRIRPVFELLGTTVADTPDAADERTVLELGAGMWTAPFSDDSPLSPLSIGFGWKWPVAGRSESEVTGVVIFEWSFGV